MTRKNAYASTTRMTEVMSPSRTLMFADTAMANDKNFMIEYSFAEPPFTIYNGRPVTSFYMSPSIHFRHDLRANIGWADGHVEARRIADFSDENAYGICSVGMNLGWFEPINNTEFDLE
jgi:prepilin-type processing-associated H-X9-DG protein